MTSRNTDALSQAALELLPSIYPDAAIEVAAQLCDIHAVIVSRKADTSDSDTFIAASYATACLAAASMVAAEDTPLSVKAGDVSVSGESGAERAAQLRSEAERALAPYFMAAPLTAVRG